MIGEKSDGMTVLGWRRERSSKKKWRMGAGYLDKVTGLGGSVGSDTVEAGKTPDDGNVQMEDFGNCCFVRRWSKFSRNSASVRTSPTGLMRRGGWERRPMSAALASFSDANTTNACSFAFPSHQKLIPLLSDGDRPVSN